ncbi:MAG TPA: hypothetical protein VGF14_02090 [Alphaproteobacteria bacterium]
MEEERKYPQPEGSESWGDNEWIAYCVTLREKHSDLQRNGREISDLQTMINLKDEHNHIIEGINAKNRLLEGGHPN